MNIRQLSLYDYYKNYIALLSELTDVGNISFNSFELKFNLINSNKNHNIFVIEDQNKIITTGTLLIEDKFIHNCSKIGHIEDIIVHSNYRGHGLGKKIIQYLTNYAKDNGCYKVILDCEKNYMQFYEKLGFNEKNIQMAIYF